jgi:hypothetical protein
MVAYHFTLREPIGYASYFAMNPYKVNILLGFDYLLWTRPLFPRDQLININPSDLFPYTESDLPKANVYID